MEEVCGGTKPYLKTEAIEKEHRRIMDKAILQFSSKKKMGGDEFSQTCKEQLEKDIEDTFIQFKAHNESKNIFKSARTRYSLPSQFSLHNIGHIWFYRFVCIGKHM
ncbi:hypothetical protein NQ317_012853 [Molorchus minor]|uniref:Uncharacterized protein n=1 Tax=Molorchus minor TaxID=1323400 RepID=A0ABQ9IR11_9CUCU|nr:hypothetical protein NQ317_012853 [Molorchus minor]